MKVGLGIMTTDTQNLNGNGKVLKLEIFCENLWGCQRLWNDKAKYGHYIKPIFLMMQIYLMNLLKKLLRKNIYNTFNAISCDGDTSTNDMVSIFSTGKAASHRKIKNITDK